MKPLRNFIFVKFDESLPNQANILLPTVTHKWREATDQIGNRATVVQVGPGNRTPKKGTLIPMLSNPGDVVRVSEIQYPSFRHNGEKYHIVNEMDIVGVEVSP